MTETMIELDPALRLLEAILFASDEPLTLPVLQNQMGEAADVSALLSALQKHYEGRGVHLVETGGVWSFRTDPALAPLMKITRPSRRKLPKAASEVLAIIAYHQPVTRSEIESIRGVETSKGTLDILLELGWVRPGKRRETPGRPLTWKTTPEFLSHFNLEALKDLPGMDDLKAAGLLDARPILETMSVEGGDAPDPDDAEFANWVDENAE
jgi:segregation and condensation protein B